MKRSILYGALVIVIFGLCGPSKSRAQGAYLELGTVKKYKKTVVVCPVGSPEENGSLLLDAIAGITDAGADNPYLVELEPGVYNTSDVPLEMKPYVDIEGAGVGTTRIEGAINASYSGIVIGADDAEIRFLSIENTGGGTGWNSIGVYCGGTSPRLLHVSVTARNGYYASHAVSCLSSSAPLLENVRLEAHDGQTLSIGLCAYDSAGPRIRHSEIFVSGGGTENDGVQSQNNSEVFLNDVEIDAVGNTAHGVYNETGSAVDIRDSNIRADYAVMITSTNGGGGDIRIESSSITGTYNSLRNDNPGSATLYVGSSRIEGAVSASCVVCAHVHDGDFNMLDASCN